MERLNFDDLFNSKSPHSQTTPSPPCTSGFTGGGRPSTAHHGTFHARPMKPRFRMPDISPVRIVDIICIALLGLFVLSVLTNWNKTVQIVASVLLWAMDSAIVLGVIAIVILAVSRGFRRLFRRIF